MARKGVFANITSSEADPQQRKVTPGYASRGASRSMMSSLSELAEKVAKADLAVSGDAVLELDPDLIDDSFVSDRMGEDEEAFQELVDAIRERGQDTPVLLRPSPDNEGRYQTVFGHRRVRAARLLGRPVRAVVRDVTDLAHIIAQGQENSARENLSFIERASFAQRLVNLGYDRSSVQMALSVDAPMLTRMLSVASRIPPRVIETIGAAKAVGRDRWLEFTRQIEHPASASLANSLVSDPRLPPLSSEQRFELFLAEMRDARKPPKKHKPVGTWRSPDDAVTAEFKGAAKSYSISLKSKDAAKFGRFITENLERLHEEFLETTKSQGD
jgi:ParB family transcriptional regulator, chromosome partitioning protein